jgi:acyl-CoA thioesterase FadM
MTTDARIELGKPTECLAATVATSQTNALGHLKAAQYIVLFDDAFMALVVGQGLTDAELRHGVTSPFLADLHATYMKELPPGARVAIAAQLLGFSEKHLRLLLLMTDCADGRMAATCELSIVNMNLNTRRPGPWSPQQTVILDQLCAAHAGLPVPGQSV